MTAIAVNGRVQAVSLSGDANNDGRLTTGEVIEARLTFNEPVHLTDGATATVTLDIGGEAVTAPCVSGSGTAALPFSHEVTEAQSPVSITLVNPNSLTVTRGSLESGTGVPASLADLGAVYPRARAQRSVPNARLPAEVVDGR